MVGLKTVLMGRVVVTWLRTFPGRRLALYPFLPSQIRIFDAMLGQMQAAVLVLGLACVVCWELTGYLLALAWLCLLQVPGWN